MADVLASARLLGVIETVLDVAVPQQLLDYWCWAACTAAVVGFFDAGRTPSQCEVADAVLKRGDCCDRNPGCNEAALVRDALEVTGNLAWSVAGPVGRRTILQELVARRPVVVRVEYPGGYGHFVIIDGYRPTGFFQLRDSRGQRDLRMRLSRLSRRYDGEAVWSHTYGTRP